MVLQVYPVLCRAGYMDNYSYILTESKSNLTAVLDPSETEPIIAALQHLKVTPTYIFNTHHHFDHTDSNRDLKKLYGAKVVANKNDSPRIPGFDIGVEPGKTFDFGQTKAHIIDVSAHTQGHILWYFPQDKIVFTGDTLFNLCIGGLFEGTTTEMFAALQKIRQLPEDVLFYPGHEYTLPSANFALNNASDSKEVMAYIQRAKERLQQHLPVAPIALGIEKKCNPYLRADTLENFTKLFR